MTPHERAELKALIHERSKHRAEVQFRLEGTTRCVKCDREMEPKPGKRYCSSMCQRRQAAKLYSANRRNSPAN